MGDAPCVHAVSGGPLRGSDTKTHPDHSVHGPQSHSHTTRVGTTEQDFSKGQPTANGLVAVEK